MTLYHFTKPESLANIQKHGITLGVIPIPTKCDWLFIRGYQWLSSNPNFAQPWDTREHQNYDRTRYRLTVRIPKTSLDDLMEWIPAAVFLNFPSEGLTEFNYGGEGANWYLFKGRIPPKWIRSIDERPKQA